MAQYNFVEFVEEIFLPDLDTMIENDLHYYAFPSICQAIEVMGSIYDQSKLETVGKTETRFTNGIKKLFKGDKYKNNQARIYKELRGAFVHQFRPGASYIVASNHKDGIDLEKHLTKDQSGRTIWVIEVFRDDFEAAFTRFKKELSFQKNGLDIDKVTRPYIEIAEIEFPSLKPEIRPTFIPDTPNTTSNAHLQTGTSPPKPDGTGSLG